MSQLVGALAALGVVVALAPLAFVLHALEEWSHR